jgi:hypothetical protein
MTHYLGLDWLAMALTFTAIYLLGNKRRVGFVVMMVGNLSWAVIGLWAHSYAMVLANLGFFSMKCSRLFEVGSSGPGKPVTSRLDRRYVH